MRRRLVHLALLVGGLAPIIVFSAQQAAPVQAPTSEQVFKNIKVFNGVPASDLIPAMQFMSASMKYQCTDCHDPKDYAAETPKKETARKMVVMQREINTKHFNGRLEVTCNSCHGGQEHPVGTPIPAGISLRHERIENGPTPASLFEKHLAAVGKVPGMLNRSGTLTAPNDETHKIETESLGFVQAEGGKFWLVAGNRQIIADGKTIRYGGQAIYDEGLNIFGRIGRAWRDSAQFAGLERTILSGKDTIGKMNVLVVRASRPATSSTEELWFDAKSGLLVRMVNIRRSTIGAVVSSIDYLNYKTVSGVKVPMRVVMTFASGEQWIMDFKTAKLTDTVDEALFKG